MKKAIYVFIAMLFISCKDASEEKYFQIKGDYHSSLDEIKIDFLKAVTEEEKAALMSRIPNTDE